MSATLSPALAGHHASHQHSAAPFETRSGHLAQDLAGRRFNAVALYDPRAATLEVNHQISGWIRRFEYRLLWRPPIATPAAPLLARWAATLNAPEQHARALDRHGLDRIERLAWRLHGYDIEYALDADSLPGTFSLRQHFSLLGWHAHSIHLNTSFAQWFIGHRAKVPLLCARFGAISSPGVSNMTGRHRVDWVLPIAPLLQTIPGKLAP